MFGLTKREQRWKADQKAAELLVDLFKEKFRADAEIESAKAISDLSELMRLKEENSRLREILMRYRREFPLGNHPDILAEIVDKEIGK